MSDISFECGKCGQSLEAPEEMAGQTVECPACQQAVAIPKIVAADQSDAACPECGAGMESDAVLCVNCGFHKGLGGKIKTDFA